MFFPISAIDNKDISRIRAHKSWKLYLLFLSAIKSPVLTCSDFYSQYPFFIEYLCLVFFAPILVSIMKTCILV